MAMDVGCKDNFTNSATAAEMYIRAVRVAAHLPRTSVASIFWLREKKMCGSATAQRVPAEPEAIEFCNAQQLC